MKDIQARPIFKKVMIGMESYALKVTDIAQKFREDMAAAAKHAAVYKDEKKILANRRKELATKARAEINQQGKELKEVLTGCVSDLRECVQDHLMHPVPAATEKLLNLYSRHSLQLSKSEVEALLTVNGGHVVGLRLIAALLRETKSPFALEYVPLETYEDDIAALEQFASMIEYEPALPLDYIHEAAQIYCGLKEQEIVPAQDQDTTGDQLRTNTLIKGAHIHRYINGQIMETQEEMNPVYLTTASTNYGIMHERIVGNADKGIKGMCQYWSADIGHTIDDLQYRDEVTPEPESGTMLKPYTAEQSSTQQ